ncbi:MAG: FliA/WhiG family RNA polymerase sigma factor [Pyrinomonadaceae bacterium]
MEIDRRSLTESHLPLVKFTADRLAAKLPPTVDREDLVGAGMLGLLDAVDKYDPQRGVLFKTYAEMRVRGAMLDSLRTLDWAPRSMRRRARAVEATFAELEQQFNRPASEEEVALELGMPLPDFHLLLGDLRGLTITELDQPANEDANSQVKRIPVDHGSTPFMQYERAETRERLAHAIDGLPPRDRQVVALYYLEELSMKEIGSMLGVTESRVSQIHTQAVLRLRSALAGRIPLPSV